jgi:hypothetical protein
MASPETRREKDQALEETAFGVNAQGRIVAATVTESHKQDPSQVPELLSQVDCVIDRFIGDGIFDHAPIHTAVENHAPGARVIIPPRKDAVLCSMARIAPTQRDQRAQYRSVVHPSYHACLPI